MTYNFDEVIERRGTDSVKWDGVKSVWGRDDLLPMWVADMDFRTPPFVMEALRKRLEHEVLGYTSACEEWYTSICSWLSRRHGWDVTREMLTFVPGIVRRSSLRIAMLHQSRRPGNGDDSRLSSLLPGDATHEARSGLLSARPERRTVSD